MKYAIAGVSGNTGSAAAEALLAKGHQVRVIVRDAAKGAPWQARGAEVAIADLSDHAALTKALSGVSGAYLLVPPNLASEDPRGHQDSIVKAFGAAVKASEIPHVVLLSSIGAQHPDGTGPIAGLHPAESLLASFPKTSLTSLRAAYFLENLAGSFAALAHGVLPSFFPKDFRFDMIGAKDIGELAAQLLINGPSGKRAVFELGSKSSMQDVANALSVKLGKSIQVAEAPLETMAPTLTGYGFTPALAKLYQEMTSAIVQGRVAFEGTHKRVQASTSLSAWVEQNAPAA
jgi:uncharacterized protein YbjT (DUF2867 family)